MKAMWLSARANAGLSFPNLSRSHDATRRAVRFWGYESSIEVSFFVTERALKHFDSGMNLEERDFLDVFDRNRDAILAAATRVYARGRRGSYELDAADF